MGSSCRTKPFFPTTGEAEMPGGGRFVWAFLCIHPSIKKETNKRDRGMERRGKKQRKREGVYKSLLQ